MEFNIYHIVYDVGDIPYQEAVVSSDSPERAEKCLKDYLVKDVFSSAQISQFLSDQTITLRLVTDTKVKADREEVLCPRTPETLEMKLAIIATEKKGVRD